MSERLLGKNVVVTGGTSGLGLAIAKTFIDERARVMITGTREASLSEALADLGSTAIGLIGDVRDLAFLDRLAAHAKECFGDVDIVVTSAGVSAFYDLANATEADYSRMMDINVKGTFFSVQKLLPLMTRGGSVILISSASLRGVGPGSIYNASKAAIRSLSMSFADELGKRGIRVNCLSPGVVPTNLQKRLNIPEEDYATLSSQITTRIPIARKGRPEEIAAGALFLASAESSYMTAADLVIDGGWMNTGF